MSYFEITTTIIITLCYLGIYDKLASMLKVMEDKNGISK